MKTLVILLILVLLPFSVSVDAGVKFETYNAALGDWGTLDDSTCIDTLSWDDLTIDDFAVAYTSPHPLAVYVVPPQKHDTLCEYITGLDTVIIMHRIECDTNFTKFFVENDSTFVQIEGITCDTIFRVEYRDVWAKKIQVWLDSLQWQQLLRILEN